MGLRMMIFIAWVLEAEVWREEVEVWGWWLGSMSPAWCLVFFVLRGL